MSHHPLLSSGDAAFGPAAVRGAGDDMAGGAVLARTCGRDTQVFSCVHSGHIKAEPFAEQPHQDFLELPCRRARGVF